MRTTMLVGLGLSCGLWPRTLSAQYRQVAATVAAPPRTLAMPEPPARIRSYRLRSTQPASVTSPAARYVFESEAKRRVEVVIAPLPSGSTLDAARRQEATFEDSLRAAQAHQTIDAYDLAFVEAVPIETPVGALSGYQAAAVVKRADRVSLTLFYAYVVRGALVELRSSMPREGWEQTDVPLFARELLIQLGR